MLISGGEIVIVPLFQFTTTAQIHGGYEGIECSRALAGSVGSAAGPVAPNGSSTVSVNVISGNDSGPGEFCAVSPGVQSAADEDADGDMIVLTATNLPDSFVPAGAMPVPPAGSANPGGANRVVAGNHVQPGELHPGDGQDRGITSTGDGTSTDNSGASTGLPGGGLIGDGSSAQAAGSAQRPRPSEGHLSASALVEDTRTDASGSNSAARPHQSSTISSDLPGDRPTSGLTQMAVSSVTMLVKPAASATFSILPWAIAELSAPATGVDTIPPSAPPQTVAQAFVNGRAAAVLHVVDSIVTAPSVGTSAALVNLFHVDALATFGDAMGAFIDESAARPVARGPASHSRARKITAGVVAADVLLISCWLATRKRQESAGQTDARDGSFSFCDDLALFAR